jgi:hypothetical protein
VGSGPAYRLSPTSAAVARRQPIARLLCDLRRRRREYGVHIELFAHRLVVPVPAGIGVAPPLRRAGAYVLGGACTYPVTTVEPTGVVRIATDTSLGVLFAIWGQPLKANRLASFGGRVLAFVDGRRWTHDPGSIPLDRHTQVVLEVAGYIPPHPRYTFSPGL